MENTQSNIDLTGMVSEYTKLTDELAKITKEYEATKEALQSKMQAIKANLLAYCKEFDVTSVKTNAGMFYRVVKTKYWTSDWEAMGRFIVENNVPQLLEKRIVQSNMKQFLEENPDLLPPGLNVDSEYTLTIKRSK